MTPETLWVCLMSLRDAANLKGNNDTQWAGHADATAAAAPSYCTLKGPWVSCQVLSSETHLAKMSSCEWRLSSYVGDNVFTDLLRTAIPDSSGTTPYVQGLGDCGTTV